MKKKEVAIRRRCVHLVSYLRFQKISRAEDYDEERAVAHVRRLLDIVACTTNFGPPSPSPAKNVAGTVAKSGKSEVPPVKQSTKDAAVATADMDGEISHSCPKLENFYEFFSLSHLTAPLQCNT